MKYREEAGISTLIMKDTGKKPIVPRTRPRFTEEGLKGNEEHKQESTDGRTDLMDELVRLKAKPVIPGRATVSMMEQFRRFPWTQDTMLAVGQLDQALRAFLRWYVEVEDQEIRE